MKSALNVCLIAALCAIYFVGFGEFVGVLARADLPWLRLGGKPTWEIVPLLMLSDFIVIFIGAAFVAIILALRFPNHPFILGLVVAAPSAMFLAWSTVRMLPIERSLHISHSVSHVMIEVEHFVVMLFAPAVFASVLARIVHNNRRKPAGYQQSE